MYTSSIAEAVKSRRRIVRGVLNPADSSQSGHRALDSETAVFDRNSSAHQEPNQSSAQNEGHETRKESTSKDQGVQEGATNVKRGTTISPRLLRQRKIKDRKDRKQLRSASSVRGSIASSQSFAQSKTAPTTSSESEKAYTAHRTRPSSTCNPSRLTRRQRVLRDRSMKEAQTTLRTTCASGS